MSIDLGTIAAIGFDEFQPDTWLSCFRELGCKFVQAYRNQQSLPSLQQMKDYIAAGGMRCDSLHGLYGEQYDPSAPSEADRQSAVNTFRSEGELALELGGPLVVVHCATIRQDGVSDQERQIRLAQLRKSITELGQFGQSIGVKYAFENLPRYHAIGWDVAELAGMLSELAVPNTGLCLDTGHAHMVGNVTEAIANAGDQMIYVHFSDNSGASDDHDMPTCGTLDTEAVARALNKANYSSTMMLEVFYGLDKLRQLIDEGCAERLARIVRLANGQSER